LSPQKFEVFKTQDDECDTLTLRDPITDEIYTTECVKMDKVVRYLEILLGSRKIRKMKYSDRVLTKI
jgi:hypothetical protein